MTVSNMPWTELLESPLVLLLGAAVFLLVVGMPPLWLCLQHRRRSRELLHMERMRAIEAGVPFEPPRPDESKASKKRRQDPEFWIAFWLGGAVPLMSIVVAGGIVVAGLVSRQSDGDFAASLAAWIGATTLGMTGVIGAIVLMAVRIQHRYSARHGSPAASGQAAPPTDGGKANPAEKKPQPAEKPRAAGKPHREPPRDLGFGAWLESLAQRMQAR